MSKILKFRNMIMFVNFSEISTGKASSNLFYPKAHQAFPSIA